MREVFYELLLERDGRTKIHGPNTKTLTNKLSDERFPRTCGSIHDGNVFTRFENT
jgi:hypothetical protein